MQTGKNNLFGDSDHYLIVENVTTVKTTIMLFQLQNNVFYIVPFKLSGLHNAFWKYYH